MKGKYQVFNIIDEQGRLKAVDFYNNGFIGQSDSHGFSYLEARKILAKGKPIGLELLVSENPKEIIAGVEELVRKELKW